MNDTKITEQANIKTPVCVCVCVCFRGNSKYHYYGLRIKSNSPLHRLVEDQQHLAMRQQPVLTETEVCVFIVCVLLNTCCC